MLPRSRERHEGDFAVSLYISRYFVDGVGIKNRRSAENPIMTNLEEVKRHGVVKDHDEPESYHIVKDEERIRNAQ